MKIIQLFASINREAGKADGMNGITGWIPPAGNLEDMPVEIQRYGTRVWAVYMGGQLLCVTEYLKGAQAVKSLVEQLQDALRQAQGVVEPAAKPTPESMETMEPMEPMAFDVAETVGA